MRTVNLSAVEHASPHEALQWIDCGPEGHDVAISLAGRHFSTTRRELDRVQSLGFQPATWHDVDGLLMSVPGRDA